MPHGGALVTVECEAQQRISTPGFSLPPAKLFIGDFTGLFAIALVMLALTVVGHTVVLTLRFHKESSSAGTYRVHRPSDSGFGSTLVMFSAAA
jgi:hypothetical protein